MVAAAHEHSEAPAGFRTRLSTWLEAHSPCSATGQAVRLVILLAIGGAVGAAVLDTLPDLSPPARAVIQVLGTFALAVFTIEYLVRLWTAPERCPASTSTLSTRLRYATTPLGIVDLVVILPSYATLMLPMPEIAQSTLTLLALLKLARYAPALPLVIDVVRLERRPLLAALFVMSILLVFASALMYELERQTQPEVFSSIPRSLWWGIVTIASVGYGDMVPQTALGRILGGVVMLLGIAMFAVPAGILATGFAAEIRRRDFVVTWQTVANVPLFATLDARTIAEIARLLEPRVVPAHYVIVHRGEPANAMYFIMAGEVEVELDPHPIRLREGQFFGEIALLKDTLRTATVTSVTECRLLVLGVANFRRLIDRHPVLKANIERVAETRLRELHPESHRS